MKLARSCLAGFFFVAFALGSLLLGLLLFPVVLLLGTGRKARRRMRALVRVTYRLFVWAARVTGLFRVEISPEDRTRLVALRGCVVVSNHLTLIDIIILIAHLGDATAIAKSAAARNPFYARIVKSIFLVNDDPEGVLADAGKLLRQGVNLIVFPEGTRTPSDAVHRRLRRGAAQIALAAECPVWAICLACDPPVLAKGQPWHDVGARTIVYSLRVLGEVPPPPATGSRHADAVAFTQRMDQTLFAICGTK